MKVKNTEISLDEAIKLADYDNLLLKHYNNLLLNDYQISVLTNNGFNYNNYGSMQELLFDIEEYLNEEYNEELDLVSNQIAEMIYYRDTKK